MLQPRLTVFTPFVVALALATAPRGLLCLIPYAVELVVWLAFYGGRRS